MDARPLEKFEKDDIQKLRELFVVITSCDYQIKGNALEKAGSLFSWYRTLEKKIDSALKMQALNDLDKKPKLKTLESE